MIKWWGFAVLFLFIPFNAQKGYLLNAQKSYQQEIQTVKAPAHYPVPDLKRHHEYHQTLMMKLFLSDVEPEKGEDKQVKIRDKGKSKVVLDFEQALEIIRKIDNLTLGIPKIIYLVGWQYNGHDSKYPAWGEVNPELKRPQDKTAL